MQDSVPIMVSIVCNAYNQEKYICQALDSILNQITDFYYEILVHDDASTDSTANLIRVYEKKFPGLIKPIYQTENQYSRGVKISKEIQFPRAKGKYIAFCEGDDYWTDPNKLQAQFDAMEKHPDVDICAHKGVLIRGKDIAGYVAPRNEDCIIPFEDVVLGGGDFVVTNSLMFRAEMFKKMSPILDILSMDYTFQLCGAVSGGMLYINRCMSAYRVSVEGSWTQSIQQNRDSLIIHSGLVEFMLRSLDRFTEHRYSEAINQKIRKNELRRLELMEDYGAILDREHREALSREPVKYRIKILLKHMKKKFFMSGK